MEQVLQQIQQLQVVAPTTEPGKFSLTSIDAETYSHWNYAFIQFKLLWCYLCTKIRKDVLYSYIWYDVWQWWFGIIQNQASTLVCFQYWNTDVCGSDPCQNGGTCNVQVRYGYSCIYTDVHNGTGNYIILSFYIVMTYLVLNLLYYYIIAIE